MKMLKKVITLVILISAATIAPAQNLYKYAINNSIQVKKNGVFLDNAWAGGLNNPQLNQIDVNLDFIKDIVIFDRAGDILRVYINDGVDDEPIYRYAPEYTSYFPEGMNNFVLFRDYNNDGKEDIFTYSNGGLRVYKNSSDSTLKFEKITDYLPAIVFGNVSGVYAISVDYPNISDIDGDGDLDILSVNIWGTFVNYYENKSPNHDSLFYERDDGCWGNFYENQLNDSIVLGATCKSGGDDDAKLAANGGVQRHTGATLLATDLYQNGAADILLGDVGYSNIIRLKNGGTPTAANMITADYHYPGSNSEEINIPTFPTTFFMDVNNDGRKDLIAAPNQRDGAMDTGNVWFYENFGLNNLPNFQLERKNLLVGDQIDVGTMAFPALADISGDGLPDLMIGNQGYFESYDGNNFITEYQSQIAYYKNTGDSTHPEFELITDDLQGISSTGLDRIAPTFGDLDGDGDNDMIIGEIDGTIRYYQNIAPSGQMANFILADTFSGQTFGVQPSPYLFDVDGDNALDLLVGQKNGNIRLYLNQGGTSSPIYSNSSTDTLGGIFNYVPGRENNAMPFISTINGGTSNVLVVADGIGNLLYYDGLDNNLLGNYTLIDSMKVSNSMLSVTGANLTNNDSIELIVGERPGGVMFLNLDEDAYNAPPFFCDTCIADTTPDGVWEWNSTKPYFDIVPNPNNGNFNVRVNANTASNTIITIIDLSGKTVEQKNYSALQGENNFAIKTAQLHAGVYIVQVQMNGEFYRSKLIIQ